MSETQPLVRLEGVVKKYAPVGGNADSTAEAVLRGVDLEIEAGDSIAVLGPSGSGKSTLLSIAGTLEPPTAGRVLYRGRDLAGLPPDDLADLRNREIGFVFQHHHLLPQCTALENVLVPTLPRARGRDPGVIADRARALLESVGLGARCAHRPAQLSGGERQRVAVVRALINGPRLLLADEPTGSLDEASTEALGELLVGLNEREAVALVVVTHSRRLAERMKRVLELRNGVLVPREAPQ